MYLNLKTTTLLFSLFLSLTLNAQDVTITQPENATVYRGYENRILVNIAECTNESVNDIQLECANCVLSKVNKPGGYILKPGRGKIAIVYVNKTEDGTTTTLDSIEYRVSNLPDPTLYWGGSKSGVKASKSSRALLAKYSPEIPLKASFKVTKWTFTCNGETAVGIGGSLGPAGSIITSISEETQVAIAATVVGPDGIARQIGGAWPIGSIKK